MDRYNMDRKIIFTNKLNFLKENLYRRKNSIFYVVTEENNQSNLIRNYLSSLSNTYEIRRRDIIEEEKFVKEYSAFIHNLNLKNASRLWWAMNFTSKNPLLASLCKNIYDSLSIIKLIKNYPDKSLVIVSSSNALKKYIKQWADKKGIYVNAFISAKPNAKFILSHIPALFIFYAFLKASLRKILSRLIIGNITTALRKDYTFITQFENSSFKKDGAFYDVYFGQQLREFFKKENKSFITCGYVACAFKNIIKNTRKYRQADTVYPLEYFISFSNLFRALRDSIFSYFKRHARLQSNIKLEGENVLGFIKNEVDRAYNSGQVFVNLSVFYSVKGLLKLSYTQKILYPFENRSWEKMILLAIQETPQNIKLVGYQHASLTPKHINFLLEKEEPAEIPFPDEIITMGYITKNMMTSLFNFPEDKIKVGCALRQTLPQIDVSENKFPHKINRILVALASSVDEYVGVLKFLDSAFTKSQTYKVIVRPHPAINFKRALKIYKPGKLKYELDNLPLHDSLKISDIVIYASSTVSMEAICFGIPVIYIVLNDLLNSDPMFNVNYLKWTCKDPEQLTQLIENIAKIDNVTFLDMQKKAKKFTESYCVTTTESAMEVFI